MKHNIKMIKIYYENNEVQTITFNPDETIKNQEWLGDSPITD